MVTKRFLDEYQNENIDGAGVTEIENLDLIDFESDETEAGDGRMVLVLVESRLLNDVGGEGPATTELVDRLERLKEDLWLDGFTTRFIEADVYSGEEHQDGRTVLALRQFFQEVWERYNDFQGVLLVGSFPDPTLVRRWVWRRKLTRTIEGTEHHGDFLRIVPERVAGRSDIVLADLTGNWDEIYEAGPKNLESLVALPDETVADGWPHDDEVFTSDIFESETAEFEDFFWIRDDQYTIEHRDAERLEIRTQVDRRNPEVDAAERNLPNPIARPDIHVSRLNAQNIANRPDESVTDDNGTPLVDENGEPQTVELHNSSPDDYFSFDPGLERQMLIDYLDRNHAFRSGELAESVSHRAAAAAKGFSAQRMLSHLEKADDDFENGVKYDEASLLEYVRFLKDSAVLSGVWAHSNRWNTSFGDDYDVDQLEAAVGGTPWRWTNTSGDRYEPSLTDQNGTADHFVYRSLYFNDALPDDAASFWIHTGCDFNTPGLVEDEPYSHPGYGTFQQAESMLFCCKGLALVSRAKTYYDLPDGFPDTFGESLTTRFGDGMTEFYRRDAVNGSLGTFDGVADCKIAYSWSVVGDWTLRLRYYQHDDDCIPLDSTSLSVQRIRGNWTVVEGDDSLLLTAPTEDEAERIVEVIQHYDLDQYCFVGRPEPSMEYYLVDGSAPEGRIAGDDATSHNAYYYDAVEHGDRMTVTDGYSAILSCPNYREAATALRVLRKYRFDTSGYVGRPDSSMEYFLRTGDVE